MQELYTARLCAGQQTRPGANVVSIGPQLSHDDEAIGDLHTSKRQRMSPGGSPLTCMIAISLNSGHTT